MTEKQHRQWLEQQINDCEDLFIEIKELERTDRAAAISADIELRRYSLELARELYRLDKHDHSRKEEKKNA